MNMADIGLLVLVYIYAVSYTHLDVYKRQHTVPVDSVIKDLREVD